MSKVLLGTVILAAIAVSIVSAQQTTATLTGTITDPTGAAIPGVVVKATNLATNAARETRTDESGSYTLPFLPAGDYSVNTAARGFQAQKTDRLDALQVQQTARAGYATQDRRGHRNRHGRSHAASLQTDNATRGHRNRRR